MERSQPMPEGRPRRGWLRRNWLWLVLLVVLLPVAAAAGAFFAIVASIRGSQPYRLAWQQVCKDPQVTQRLGEPVKDTTWIPAGSIHTEGSRGDANLIFQIAGPKGKANVSTQARRFDGRWEVVRLEVTFEDGKRVPLSTDSGGAGDDAPKFQPGGAAPKFNPGAAPPPSAGGDAPKWKPGGDQGAAPH